MTVNDSLVMGVLDCRHVYTQTVHILKERPPGKEEGICENKIRERRGAERRSSDESATLRGRKGAIYTSGYQIRIKLNAVLGFWRLHNFFVLLFF